jgi:hypothetical protein
VGWDGWGGGMGRDLFLVLASGRPFLAPACFRLRVVWPGLLFKWRGPPPLVGIVFGGGPVKT